MTGVRTTVGKASDAVVRRNTVTGTSSAAHPTMANATSRPAAGGVIPLAKPAGPHPRSRKTRSRPASGSPVATGLAETASAPIADPTDGVTAAALANARADTDSVAVPRLRARAAFKPRGDSEAPRGPRREAPAMERGPRQPGVVKFFKADKGFGFIMPDSGEPDVFVHISAVERSGLTTLESGQRVSFETEPDRHGKGPKAVELQIEEGGDQPA